MMNSHHISVQERSSQTVAADVVEAVPKEFWKAADCTVQRSPSEPAWTLSARDSVGVSRITTPIGDVTMEITAKLSGVDIFLLADYAFDQRNDPLRILDFDDPFLDAVRSDQTACLLMWHVRNISRFASQWLRRDYRTIDRVFEGKVKGRILLDQYVKDHLAVGQAARIPCRTIEQTQDTPNNKILKAGLRYAATLSHSLSVPAAGQAVRKQVAATLPKFAQVTDINPGLSDMRRTSTRGPQRHYAAVLHSTRNLLADKFINTRLGGQPSQSFMWQMPILFQEAVRGIISSFTDIELEDSAPPRASIYSADGTTRLRYSKVDPDLVMQTPTGRHVLLDTKYKNVLTTEPSTGEDSDEIVRLTPKQHITVSRADIYQAVAYRRHDRWIGSDSGLLFPVSLTVGEPLPSPLQVRGFGKPIPLVFIDIGPNARRNLGSFRTELDNLHSLQNNSRSHVGNRHEVHPE